MKVTGNLLKMDSEIRGEVHYSLRLGNELLVLNNFIGKEIAITNLHKINCIKCGKSTKTSFAQGFCYPCFISAPEAEDCVLRPELCKAHEGIARDMNFAYGHCLIDHFVYLALSGGLKVGVTRHTQIPTRWIDQGAGSAIIVARTPNRHLAGTIEVALKNHLNDKTNWRIMLTRENHSDINLIDEKNKVISLLHSDFKKYTLPEENTITEIHYPVLHYPIKVKSINLDNTENFRDILIGIKGQYLVFRNGSVINIRKYAGYLVELSC
jgi:hypothetical protein